MKWYKSLPLIVATGTALAGGCSISYGPSLMIASGKIVYHENAEGQTKTCGKNSENYIINLEDSDGLVRSYNLNGESCFLSSLEKKIELGDELVIMGSTHGGRHVTLKEYKVIKKSKKD